MSHCPFWFTCTDCPLFGGSSCVGPYPENEEETIFFNMGFMPVVGRDAVTRHLFPMGGNFVDNFDQSQGFLYG